MDPANRDLIERWIVGVEQRRERHCLLVKGTVGGIATDAWLV